MTLQVVSIEAKQVFCTNETRIENKGAISLSTASAYCLTEQIELLVCCCRRSNESVI